MFGVFFWVERHKIMAKTLHGGFGGHFLHWEPARFDTYKYIYGGLSSSLQWKAAHLDIETIDYRKTMDQWHYIDCNMVYIKHTVIYSTNIIWDNIIWYSII